jgi:acyl-homoserine-lactone acylase
MTTKPFWPTAIATVGLAVLILVIGVLVWLYRPLPSNPSAEFLAQAAHSYDAQIIRDQWGVPHIMGERDADASYGLAYAHAEDDFETIQEMIAATRGKLASYRGKDAAPTDYIVALMDVWGTVDRAYSSSVPDDVKAIANGYAAGLNLYAAQHQNKTWAGLAPFRAEDIIAGFVFKTPFFYGLDKVLLELFGDQRHAEVALDPGSTLGSWQARPNTGAELGSNAIAVSAARSGDQKTRLLINSHQPMTGPVAWYEAHLMSNQGLNISGGLFPGTPVVLHGFNQKIAWANTVNHIDLSDVYSLTINPDNKMQYRLDGQWLDFDVETVTIEVKLFGPFRYPAKRKVLRSKHGPVVDAAHGAYALRYAGIDEIRQLEQYYRLNQAQNLDQFLGAMSINALPSINYVYADYQDNIAFIHNAQYPLRNDAWDWEKDLPGDRSDLIWQSYRPFESIPKVINPESGLLFNANNTPFSSTDGQDNLRKADFPQSMGLDDNQTNRSLRLIELTDGQSLVDKDRLLELKFDLSYSPKSDKIKLLNKILALDVSDLPELQEAVFELSRWDRSTDIKNRQTALAILTLRKIVRSDDPKDHSVDKLRSALSWAVDYLEEHHGSLTPRWGDLNRLVRGDVDIAVDGGPDTLRAIYSFGLPEGTPPNATHGDTWMALVEWDQKGVMSADVVHQFGSATLDNTSAHYADQAPLFAAKQWRKALIDIEDIKSNATRTYSPKRDQ